MSGRTIMVFARPEAYIQKYYDLTNCSVCELERALKDHCEQVGIHPTNAAITLPGFKPNYECIVKGTSTTSMTLYDVARQILRLHGRDV